MIRRTRLAVAAIAGLSLIAASCGGGDEDTPATQAETTTAPEPVVTEADPVVTEAEPVVTEPVVTEPVETDPPETEPVEELEASDVGVTEEAITIAVAISDLEAIRAMGISIPETLTTEHLLNRWTVYFDAWNAEGGINGRAVEPLLVTWNPLDPSTFDSLCAAATIDNEAFMLINGTGLSAVAMQCVADGGLPIMYGDVVSQDLLDTGLVVSLAPPAQVMATAGVAAWLADEPIAAPAKIGVLSSNSPLISAAGDAAAEALVEAGYEVQVIETNSLGGDNAATNEEGGAAVGTFAAAGVQHVFVATPFTENTGFWNAAAGGVMPYTLLDTASSQCSTFGLSRAPAASAGSVCATVFDHATAEGQAPRPDLPFEAECRAFFDANFAEYYGGKSNSGVPAGQILTDVDGKVLISDYAPGECTIANLLRQGLTNAGINPTRDSFIEALLNLGEQPFANGSNGVGTLSPDKPYLADSAHTIRITTADTTVKADANGTYNGCAAPVNCGVVVGDWASVN